MDEIHITCLYKLKHTDPIPYSPNCIHMTYLDLILLLAESQHLPVARYI